MRVTSVLAAALLAACASNSPPSTTPEAQTVRVSTNLGSGRSNSATRTAPTNDVRFDTLPLPLERIWKTLPGVYAALDMPIAHYDAEKNTLGNTGMKTYRRLGKMPLTRILDCGRTQIGPSADSYEIHMSVLTTLRPVDSITTVVATNIEASGKPMQYTGGDTRCRTTGALEQDIVLLLKTRLLQ